MIIEERNNELYTLPTKELQVFSGIDLKILNLLAKKPSYPKQIARVLGLHEQKVYYHIKNLKKMGIIKVASKEIHGGTVANIFTLAKPSFFVKFRDLEIAKRIPKSSDEFLEPFIKDGRLNAKIVVGSPDPHGPERARSRDVSYALDLAMFLGTFINKLDESCIALDIELRKQDMNENLILVGGPVTNKISKMVNNKLPVRFNEKKYIYSSKTRKTYKQDECGIIVKAPNPFYNKKKILYIAGKRFMGTRAAILAFLQKFDKIKKNSSIVMGIDTDYDGIIDSVGLLE